MAQKHHIKFRVRFFPNPCISSPYSHASLPQPARVTTMPLIAGIQRPSNEVSRHEEIPQQLVPRRRRGRYL